MRRTFRHHVYIVINKITIEKQKTWTIKPENNRTQSNKCGLPYVSDVLLHKRMRDALLLFTVEQIVQERHVLVVF